MPSTAASTELRKRDGSRKVSPLLPWEREDKNLKTENPSNFVTHNLMKNSKRSEENGVPIPNVCPYSDTTEYL